MYKINIVRIAYDKQSCIDANGKKYTIKNIANNIDDFNVCIRRYTGTKYKDNHIIVFKPKNKVVNNHIQNNRHTFESVETYNNNSSTKIYFTFIIEDRGSAFNIIKGIVEKVSLDLGVCIVCKYVRAGGVGNIPDILNYIVLNKSKLCFIMYDSGLKDINTINKIETTIDLINKENIAKCIAFSPLYIEECALTFKGIRNDIKGLNATQIKLLDNAIYYLKTGDIQSFIEYDTQTSSYKVCGQHIQEVKSTGIIKGYGIITSIEQYLADRLAEITNGKPYRFIKSANECWYVNCNCEGYKCNYEKIIGSRRKNSPVSFCNQIYLNSDKIEAIINESIFGVIYECIVKLLSGKVTGKINNKVYAQYTRG